MGDTNVTVTLLAVGPQAKKVLAHARNKGRCLSTDSTSLSIRKEITPNYKEDDYELKLTFDQPPKNVRRGFVFGWGPDCDVQLVDRENVQPWEQSLLNISPSHFSITFEGQGRIVVHDTSEIGTSVCYKDEAQKEVRSHFTRSTFKGDGAITLNIPGTGLSFQIQPGKRGNRVEEFFTKVDRVFPRSMRLGESGLARLTETTTPRYEPMYRLGEKLGSGGYGTVHKITDMRTGNVYAGKFLRKDRFSSTREVAIMKVLKHENIVRFVDFLENPDPLIIMEYLHLGSLDDVMRKGPPITLGETCTILSQSLWALHYLRSVNVVHRDIKPANILVSSRHPLTIKLADLGAAKCDDDGQTAFRSFTGTPVYIAPEIYDGELAYTYAVDIWSLGIVALQLAYGLPKTNRGQLSGKAWSDKISEFVSQKSGMLVEFISQNMLRYHPNDRCRPIECLEKLVVVKGALQASPAGTTVQSGSTDLAENSSVFTDSTSIQGGGNWRQRYSPITTIENQSVSTMPTSIPNDRSTQQLFGSISTPESSSAWAQVTRFPKDENKQQWLGSVTNAENALALTNSTSIARNCIKRKASTDSSSQQGVRRSKRLRRS